MDATPLRAPARTGAETAGGTPGLRELSAQQWRSGIAAWLGWTFDGLDMHLYTLVAAPFVAQLLGGLSTTDPEVGRYSSIIQAAFLLGWALGGGFFGRLGEIRASAFLGQLQGYRFLRLGPTFVLTGSYERAIDPQPFIWGGKVSFKPTRNLEFGCSVTTVFGGKGRPLTLSTFLHTLSREGNAQPVEPGDRRTGCDFSYRIPGLRNWLVLYNGAMAEDEPNPLLNPGAMNPGIYLPRIPKLHRLDFRAESVYTDQPSDVRNGMFYTNAHYAEGYRNYGQIMGSWIGPQGRGYQLWSTYWWSGLKKMQLGFRRQWVDPAYIRGGSLNDFSARYEFPISKTLSAQSWVQYERWNFPVLADQTNSNLAISVQLTYKPFRGKDSAQN